MIANFRIDTDTDTLKYECASIVTFHGRSGSFWTKWAEEGVDPAWVRCGQVFVTGTRPTRADVVAAFHGDL